MEVLSTKISCGITMCLQTADKVENTGSNKVTQTKFYSMRCPIKYVPFTSIYSKW